MRISGKIITSLFLFLIITQGCNYSSSKENPVKSTGKEYDLRNDLTPSRLTIAMWDFSYIYMHYKGGTYENWEDQIDGLKARGFNTVRIDAFPMIISNLKSDNEEISVEGDSLRNWGATDKDRPHAILQELVEFMKIAKEKGVYIILSTWNHSCVEYPDLRLKYASDINSYWQSWEIVLNKLKNQNLLDHVVYVDLDQEFPWFSPFNPKLTELGIETKRKRNDMEQAGLGNQLAWNNKQLDFVRNYFNSSLRHFQQLYPQLRFTFSLTSYWDEIRSLKIKSFDVLELHFWLTQMSRFNNRSGFDQIIKDRGEHDYSQYMNRINSTMASVKPMLLNEMHNEMQFAKEWADEISAPLTTTEAWGPWWHADHKDLEWQWLYNWCEECMNLSAEYGFWGTTPWNYSHPYWENWNNKEWYQRVNKRFINYK